MENNQMDNDVTMVDDVVSLNDDAAMPLESYHQRSVARYESEMSISTVGTFSYRSTESLLRLGSSLEHIFEETLERNIPPGIIAKPYDIWWQRSNRSDKQMMVEGITVTPHDVLIGQSPNYRAHVGNQLLRMQVEASALEYVNSKKASKGKIIASIVDNVCKNGGRFLRKDENDEWVEECYKKRCDVVSSRIRGMKKCQPQSFAIFPDVRRSKK